MRCKKKYLLKKNKVAFFNAFLFRFFVSRRDCRGAQRRSSAFPAAACPSGLSEKYFETKLFSKYTGLRLCFGIFFQKVAPSALRRLHSVRSVFSVLKKIFPENSIPSSEISIFSFTNFTFKALASLLNELSNEIFFENPSLIVENCFSKLSVCICFSLV